MAKTSQAQKIRDHFTQHPTDKVADAARKLGLKYQFVYVTKRTMDRKLSNKPIVNPPIQIEMFEPKSDPVNHPAHYKVGGIETIDFIEAKRLNYNMGNAVKYITRADHKGSRKQDLEKAIWYLKRELDHLI